MLDDYVGKWLIEGRLAVARKSHRLHAHVDYVVGDFMHLIGGQHILGVHFFAQLQVIGAVCAILAVLVAVVEGLDADLHRRQQFTAAKGR